jgi:outer membrane beta-barrel protein
MPLVHTLYILVLSSLLWSTAYAQDDYDFGSDDPLEEGGDDFQFDTPLDTSGTGTDKSTGGATPSFLQTDGDREDPIDRPKELTAEERELARKAENERIWVLQRRPFLKSRRFEMTPLLGYNINDPLVTLVTLGGDTNFYLNEEMAVGIRGSYTLNTETDSFDQIVENYGVFPKISRPLWTASANFQYTPIYGKFSLFKTWVFPWELYTRAGVGWLQTFIDGHVFITAGGGQRFFLNRWLTFNIDFDYQIFQETFGPQEKILLSNLVFGVGMGIYFPLDFEYRELK